MSKPAHTPGPWKVQKAAGHISVTCPTQQVAAMVAFPVYGEATANAKLIASAPDLLRQRDELLAMCQEIANSGCDLRDSERRIRLYSSITKAGGEL